MQTLAPLRVKTFGRLLTSYTVNELGDVIGVIALAILVFERTDDALATAGLFIAAKFLPAIIAPALTARLDQLDVRRVLTTLYVVEALIFVVLARMTDDFLLAVVLALALADGLFALTARGLTRGAIATTLTTPELLRAGNGLVNVGFAAASVGGAVLAGAIVSGAGVDVALYIDAGTFAAAAVLIATTRELPGKHAEREPFRARLAGSFRHIRRSRVLSALVTGQALALVFFTLVVPIEVIYAKETLDAGDFGFGLLMAAWGGGIVLGSGVFFVLRSIRPLLVVLGATTAVGVGYLGMAAVDTLLLACLFSVVGGTGNGVQWVSVMTLLQQETPDDLQARVAGVLESIGAAMPGVGFLIGGVLTSLASPRTTYAIAGVGVLLIVVAALVAAAWARRQETPVRRAEPEPAGGSAAHGTSTVAHVAAWVIVAMAIRRALGRRS